MSMEIATGIDVIEIERIEHAVDRWGERFLHRVYTDAEIAYCRGRAQSLAGRFAAKEAVSKALGVGIRTLRWVDIEVLPDQRGKPHVYLHGKAADIAAAQGLSRFDVSITHSRSDAIVVVTGWGNSEDRS
jgi:holo-[acyl-carrier protein] synthase